MDREAYEAQRHQLHDGIQAGFAEHEDGALVVGWFLVAEVREASGKPRLAFRTGDVNGENLKSWDALGYLHSAMNVTEDEGRRNTGSVGE